MDTNNIDPNMVQNMYNEMMTSGKDNITINDVLNTYGQR